MRRFLRDKRGMIFNIAVVIVTIIVLTYGFIELSKKQRVDQVLGENPSLMVLKVQEGEKALIFLDLAAKLAMSQALYEMQQSGGLTSASACGTYYGFNLWNSDGGASCEVNVNDLEATLKKTFEDNVKARMAAYPRADFLINTPAAANFVKQASLMTPGLGTGTAAGYCSGGQELTRISTYRHDSGWFPEKGVRVFIPAEANCPGSYPLIIFLHGCQANPTKYVHFGDDDFDIIPLTRELLSKRQIAPVIMAAPSQTVGDGWKDNPKGVCVGSTGALWGYKMDFKRLVELIRSELPPGITISSISFAGHSGAGCSSATGLHRALSQFPDAYAIGQFDTCVSAGFASSYRSKMSANTKLHVTFATMNSANWATFDSVLGITQSKACPTETSVPSGGVVDCLTDAAGNRWAYTLKNKDHSRAVTVGMERFLIDIFGSGVSRPTEALAAGKLTCGSSLQVSVMGDSITEDGAYWRNLRDVCVGASFKGFGISGQQTSAMLSRFKKDILDNNYNVVIIHAGVNDLAAGQSAGTIKNNLAKMFEMAKQKNMKVIATTIMPWKGYYPKKLPEARWTEDKQARLEEVNKWLLSNPPNTDFVVDLYSVMGDPTDPKKLNKMFDPGDHLHPNKMGHDRMAQEMFSKVFQRPEVAARPPATQI